MSITISRTPWIDDDGTGNTGTPINNSEKTALYNQIDAALALAAPLASPALTGTPTAPTAAPGTNTTQLATTAFDTAAIAAEAALRAAGDKWTVLSLGTTGTQNNWAPGLVGNSIVKLSNASLLTVTGLAAGYEGQIAIFIGNGAGQTDFPHNSGSSSSGNKLANKVTTGSSSLAASSAGVIAYVYDLAAGVWRCLFHDQGAPISAPYAAGNFTASAGTWTVDAGDLTVFTFYVLNNLITVHLTANTTSVSSAGAVLFAQCPGGYQAVRAQFSPAAVRAGDNGAVAVGMVSTSAGSPILQFWTNSGGTGFAVSTNNSSVDVGMTYEIK